MAAAHQFTSMHTPNATTPGMAAAFLLEPAQNLYIASTFLVQTPDSHATGVACFAVVAASLSTHTHTQRLLLHTHASSAWMTSTLCVLPRSAYRRMQCCHQYIQAQVNGRYFLYRCGRGQLCMAGGGSKAVMGSRAAGCGSEHQQVPAACCQAHQAGQPATICAPAQLDSQMASSNQVCIVSH